jgi:hypothetical protein
MRYVMALMMLTGPAYGIDLGVCHGEFALCAASSTTPTGKTMQVNGKTFQEGMAVCPILKGMSIADLSLMNGSCKTAQGKVWSLFSTVTSYPQAPTWAVTPMTVTKFVTTKESGMSNMWSFPCEIQAKKINGVRLASCYGPINESPWNSDHVPVGTESFSAAPAGALNPVGGNFPIK